MSENQTKFLQGEVWRAARDGLVDKIKTILEKDEKEIAKEIINRHTKEDGQSTTPQHKYPQTIVITANRRKG